MPLLGSSRSEGSGDIPRVASFPELGFAHGCWKTLLQREQQGGSPEGQRAELKGAEGQGFIHCFSCWEAAGWEVEAEEGL